MIKRWNENLTERKKEGMCKRKNVNRKKLKRERLWEERGIMTEENRSKRQKLRESALQTDRQC